MSEPMAQVEVLPVPDDDQRPDDSRALIRARQSQPLYDLGSMSEQEFAARTRALTLGLSRVRQLQRELLTPGTDYGTIEGVKDRVMLFKPGAERLAQFYRLVPRFVQTVDITPLA